MKSTGNEVFLPKAWILKICPKILTFEILLENNNFYGCKK